MRMQSDKGRQTSKAQVGAGSKESAAKNGLASSGAATPHSAKQNGSETKRGIFQPFTIYAAIIALCASYLLVKGIGNSYLWGDEATTAVVARNFLATGSFTGWDGRNLMAYSNGRLLDEDLTVRNPPIQHLVAAAGFALFGETTWAARFLFALFGLGAVILLAVVLREEFGGASPVAWYALAAFALSPVLLLYSRQCRYYSCAMFFALLCYWAWLRFVNRKKFFYAALASAAAVGLFYSNYLVAAAFLPALGLLHLIRWRKRVWPAKWLTLTVCAAGSLVCVLPYAIDADIWYRPDIEVEGSPWLKIVQLWWFLRDMNTMGCLPWMPFVALAVLAIWKRRDPEVRVLAGWILMGAICTAIAAILSPLGITDIPPRAAQVRFMLSAAPFLIAGWAGMLGVLHRCVRRGWLIAAPVLLVSLLTTAFIWTPDWDNPSWLMPDQPPVRWLLPAYIKEIHEPYPTAIQEAAEFIESKADKDDLVHVVPPFFMTPLLFYEGQKVLFSGLISDESPRYEMAKTLAGHLTLYDSFPDWLMVFGSLPDDAEAVDFYQRPISVKKRLMRHDYELVAKGHCFVAETNRPELFSHYFSPPSEEEAGDAVLYILHDRGLVDAR